jgi:hypothetical protein
VSVSSLPDSTTPSIAMSSSTIASATFGSRSRASASARISLRIALTIFSGAFFPSPVTGVAAPITAPGRISIAFAASEISAPAEKARRLTNA